MNIKCATISKAGRRSNNEDAFKVVEIFESNRLEILSAMVWSYVMGEVASETVSNAIVDYWNKHTEETDSEKKLKDACKATMRKLNSKAYELSHYEMGMTMVVAGIKNDKVAIAHIGTTVITFSS